MTVRAKDLYDRMCKYLEEKGWKFKKEEDDLVIHFMVSGDDIPMIMILQIDSDRELIRLTSPIPFNFEEDKRINGAIATCYVSNKLADGSFDYDIRDGSVAFRMTASFANSDIGTDLIEYMIACSSFTVDEYNDKFLALNKGIISITDFISKG